MNKKCLICGKEFIPLTGKANSRKYCYECSPVADISNTITKNSIKNLGVVLLGGECVICGYKKTNKALDFHHIDVEKKEFNISKTMHSLDNILKELLKCTILCANCHREIHSNEPIVLPKMDYTRLRDHIKFVEKQRLVKFTNTCECGNTIHYKSTQCRKCADKSQRKVERPSKEELIELLRLHGFTGVGMLHGVSDVAVRKWCKAYGFPHKIKEIRLL